MRLLGLGVLGGDIPDPFVEINFLPVAIRTEPDRVAVRIKNSKALAAEPSRIESASMH